MSQQLQAFHFRAWFENWADHLLQTISIFINPVKTKPERLKIVGSNKRRYIKR